MSYKEPVKSEQIVDNEVANNDLAQMLANTVKCRAASSTGDPGDLVIANGSILYRPLGGNLQSGDAAAIRSFLNLPSGVPVTKVVGDSPYSGVAGDFVLCDCSSGQVQVTLPSAALNAGAEITWKKIDSSANAARADASGAETIDGEILIDIINQWDSVTVVCDGTAWYIK